MYYFFFFKQKTAYEMRISDWSSDVCSSDLLATSLAIRLSGGHLELPIASTKRRRILELDDKGWTRFAIAGAVGLTERRVYQVLAEVRGSDDQPSLFP